MRRQQFNLAGISHRATEYTQANVQEGDVLTLKPEPKNKYDPNAIAVFKGDIQIGYVPAKINQSVLALIKAKSLQECVVTDTWNAGPSYVGGCKAELVIEEKKP